MTSSETGGAVAGEHLFSGLKVLDLGSFIAAPVAATILADFGADVIKIEPPGRGDALRFLSYIPTTPDATCDYFWQMDGRNKRSMTLNLKTKAGMGVLYKLIKSCDVLITNQPKASRERMGLTYDVVKQVNPAIVYASLTAYGEDGPDKNTKGFDVTAYWARSGLMDLVHNGDGPTEALPGMGDHPTAVALYAGIVTALLKREKTGEGSMVHTSLLANGLWSAAAIAQGALAGGAMGHYRARKMHTTVYDQPYQCADGRYLHCAMMDHPDYIARFFMALDLIQIFDDPRANDPACFDDFQKEIAAAVREKFTTRDAMDWAQDMLALGLRAQVIPRIEEAVEDPQVAINKIAVPPVDPEMNVPMILNHPIKIDGIDQVGPKRAPHLGEHTVEVLQGLGLDMDEISELHRQGAI